jgi:hypothetical protein
MNYSQLMARVARRIVNAGKAPASQVPSATVDTPAGKRKAALAEPADDTAKQPLPAHAALKNRG